MLALIVEKPIRNGNTQVNFSWPISNDLYGTLKFKKLNWYLSDYDLVSVNLL